MSEDSVKPVPAAEAEPAVSADTPDWKALIRREMYRDIRDDRLDQRLKDAENQLWFIEQVLRDVSMPPFTDNDLRQRVIRRQFLANTKEAKGWSAILKLPAQAVSLVVTSNGLFWADKYGKQTPLTEDELRKVAVHL